MFQTNEGDYKCNTKINRLTDMHKSAQEMLL